MSSKKEDVSKKGLEFALWMMGFVDEDEQWRKGEQLVILNFEHKHAQVFYDSNTNDVNTHMQFFRTYQTCLEYLQDEMNLKKISVNLTK